MTQYENYHVLNTLGEGTFGKVKLATRDNTFYAIKFPTKSNAYSNHVLNNIFDKEAFLVSELNHPNIIKLFASFKNGNYAKNGHHEQRPGLIFEYAPYNLAEILEFGALNEVVARTLFHQMLSGIFYLHNQNVIHRDIKPQNILFDEHYNLKICDFGLSTKVTNDTKPKTICGSDSFKSPEVLMKKHYNGVMNDLFAAGVTLFILVTGKAPFATATPNGGLYKFIALNYVDKFWLAHEKKNKFSQEFKSLINSMLSFDPTHRLSIPQILSHPWMAQDILMGDQLYKEMKKIQQENIIIKRKAVLKSLQARMPAPDKKLDQHRKFAECLDIKGPVIKGEYNKKLAKISDRYVPVLKNYEELQNILQVMGGEILIKDGKIQLTKILNGESEQKLTVEIGIEEFDEQSDCLKFKLKQGDVMAYIDTLLLFDQTILEKCE